MQNNCEKCDAHLYSALKLLQHECSSCKTIHHLCGVHRWDCKEECDYYYVRLSLKNYFHQWGIKHGIIE